MFDVTSAYGMTFVYPARDDAVGICLTRHGEFARPQRDFLINHADPNRPGTFLDDGANIGTIALPFAKHRPTWKVVAIEAHRGIATILSANARSNDCPAVEVIHAAAGDERKIVEFPTMPLDTAANMGTSNFRDTIAPKLPVLMLPLDEVAPADTRLVKVDVEGFEPETLAGAQRLVREVRPIWFVEAFYNAHRGALIEHFRRAGYATFWFYAPWVTRRPLKGVQADDPTKGDPNIVCVPPGEKLKWDLPAARPEDEEWPKDAASYPYLKAYGY